MDVPVVPHFVRVLRTERGKRLADKLVTTYLLAKHIESLIVYCQECTRHDPAKAERHNIECYLNYCDPEQDREPRNSGTQLYVK